MVPDGSGIGLYAAKGLIEAMGGQLSLDSSPDAGTTFHVQVPAEAIEAEDDPSRS
jgi:signal transduction histidine kinase